VNDYRFKFPELFQFFGGYFYQGWAADYSWEAERPHFAPVVRHFKAVNPPASVARVRNELEDLLALGLSEEELKNALAELGSNFYPPGEQMTHRAWLEAILDVLRESPTTARVLRELK
jgi:hypothetical protein